MILAYEKEMLLETNSNACLTILASGLGYIEAVSILIGCYTNKESLVFVLNMNLREEEYLSKQHKSQFCNITKLTSSQRSDKYKNGGVFFGTPTVIIADFVNQNVDIAKISTIIILNSENVSEDSTISFICYLFRENNSLGLIKAFSSDAIAIHEKTLGKTTNILCLNKILFYPRFHEIVKESLRELESTRIYLKQNTYLEEAAILIEDIIKKIYLNEKKELGSFDFMKIMVQKQSNTDIIKFKRLMSMLYSVDSLSIFIFFRSMMESQRNNEAECSWILAESAHVLFDIFKEMLQKDIKKSFENPAEFIFNIETNTFKIHLSQSTPKRIKYGENVKPSTDEIDDIESCGEHSSGDIELENDVDVSDQVLQSKMLSGFYLMNPKFKKVVEIINTDPLSKTLLLVQNITIKRIIRDSLVSVSLHDNVDVLAHTEFIHTDCSGYSKLILLNPNVTLVRAIEYVFATQPSPEIHILQYKNSYEEQKFLEEIRGEKDAFERMIYERSNLPLKLELDKIAIDEGQDENIYKIVVDSREMRSKLPFFLYKAGNKLEIKVLEVGDYMIGINKSVERKSIGDLISSLNSGRLYNQMQRLTHVYNKPILLIEFPDRKPVLSDFDVIENFRNSYIARFCLFLFNFPGIIVLWSDTHVNSVKMLRDIQKKGFIDKELISEYDPALIESLLCIPGINSFNVTRICKEFHNLCELAEADIERLEKVLDRGNATKVYEFFRNRFT